VDTQGGPSKDIAMLWVYRRTEVITPVSYIPTITYVTSGNLPLVGGADAVVSIAANDVMAAIGTNKGSNIAIFHRGAYVAFASEWSAGNVLAITGDDHGNISVTGTSGLVQFGPSGKLQSYGGAPDFLLNPVQGLAPPPEL
jgi:hypothetical protein